MKLRWNTAPQIHREIERVRNQAVADARYASAREIQLQHWWVELQKKREPTEDEVSQYGYDRKQLKKTWSRVALADSKILKLQRKLAELETLILPGMPNQTDQSIPG